MTKRKSNHGRSVFCAAAQGMVLAALGATLSVGWPAVPARAQFSVTVETDDDTDTAAEKDKKNLPPKPVFAPDVEKQLADFSAKVTAAKRKQDLEKMSSFVEKRAKSIGLDEQTRKALEPIAREAVESSVTEWFDTYDRMLRNAIKQSPAAALEGLKSATVDAETMTLAFNSRQTSAAPQDQKAWHDALQRTLSPEQFAAWEKAATEERQKLRAEIGDRLDAWLLPSRQVLEEALSSKTVELNRSLHLPKDRAAQLQSLAKDAMDQCMAKIREREEKWLGAMDDQARSQLLKNGRLYLSSNPDETPEAMPVWKTGLARLLTADEQKQVETEAAVRTARRTHAFARLLTAEMDAQIAFTPEQRERLAPICDRVMAKSPEMFSGQSSADYFQLDILSFFTGGLKPAETEMKAILEPVQWEHWLDAGKRLTEERRSMAQPVAPKAQEQKPTVPPEPEEYERALSDYLETKAHKMRWKALAEAILRAEDAGRAANLPAEKIEHLKTAARGAVEESLRSWKANAEQMVRSFAGDVPVQFVRRRLESLQDYNFERKPEQPPETQPLWTDTFKADLNAEQFAAAEKSAHEREVFKNESIAGFIVATFDQSRPLTLEQHTKLTAAVTGTIKEYQPDIQNYFSGANSVSWYLSSYSIFLPITAIPEAELKSILGAESFDLWTRSRQCAYTMNYWPGLKQNHDARTQSAKK